TLLCQLAADACNRVVLAGPVESTAIGNVLVQALGLRLLGSLADAREVGRRSFEVRRDEPKNTAAWGEENGRFRGYVGAKKTGGGFGGVTLSAFSLASGSRGLKAVWESAVHEAAAPRSVPPPFPVVPEG